MKRTLTEKLHLLRRYTGDRFSPVKGYSSAKKLSRGRLRTIDRYVQLLDELLSQPHRLYKPLRGEKNEAFEFSGQRGFPRFTVAIVPVPVAAHKYRFEMDKSRPKGSRFVMIDRTTREKSWHIPARVFLDENELLYDEDEETPPEFFEDVLRNYAEQGERYTYVIEAGDHYMWGDTGNIPKVAAKLASLFQQYGAGHFDQFDKSSHFIGNWFRGIQVFSRSETMAIHALARANAKAAYMRERPGLDPFTKIRPMKNGMIGTFYRGVLQGPPINPRERTFYCRTCERPFRGQKALKRHYRATGH